jgi:peptidoglycan hydrolase CwlO-like protein
MAWMTIEVTILLSVIAVCLTAFFGYKTYIRNKKQDDQAEAGQSATIMTELKNIQSGIADIKKEVQDIKTDIKEDHDRIIRQEEALKSAFERIKILEERKGKVNV